MQTKTSIEIDASPETVWTLLTDPDKVMTWNPDIVANEPAEPGPGRVGHISVTKIKEGSRIVDYVTEVMVLEPEEYLEIEMREGSLGKNPMRVGYTLTPNRAGTTLEMTGNWKPSGIMLRLMLPLILLMGRRNSRVALGRLKALAEGEPQP